MKVRLQVLCFLLTLSWPQIWTWKPKREEEELVSGMKNRLQQFLFPPQSSQSSLRSTEEVAPEITKGTLDVQSSKSEASRSAVRLKRSSTNDQIYILIPLDKNTRKIRSNLHQQNMVKLDLARTDIPWDVPNSVVLDDGIRKICLDMVTSAPTKRKKSDNNMQYSEDFNVHQMEKGQSRLVYPNQLMSAPIQNNSCCTPPTTTYVSTTPKPPICLNLQIANMLSPDMVFKTKIYNSSQIDPNGNVRLNIIFFAETKDSPYQPAHTLKKMMMPASAGVMTKELKQMLENARFDSLNKINKWINGSNSAADIKERADQNESIKSLFQITENHESNSSNPFVNVNSERHSHKIDNSLNSANSPAAALKERQIQLLSNADVVPLNSATHKPYFDRGEVNTSLALRTLLGLIQLMQSGNSHEIQPQDNLNRVY